DGQPGEDFLHRWLSTKRVEPGQRSGVFKCRIHSRYLLYRMLSTGTRRQPQSSQRGRLSSGMSSGILDLPYRGLGGGVDGGFTGVFTLATGLDCGLVGVGPGLTDFAGSIRHESGQQGMKVRGLEYDTLHLLAAALHGLARNRENLLAVQLQPVDNGPLLNLAGISQVGVFQVAADSEVDGMFELLDEFGKPLFDKTVDRYGSKLKTATGNGHGLTAGDGIDDKQDNVLVAHVAHGSGLGSIRYLGSAGLGAFRGFRTITGMLSASGSISVSHIFCHSSLSFSHSSSLPPSHQPSFSHNSQMELIRSLMLCGPTNTGCGSITDGSPSIKTLASG